MIRPMIVAAFALFLLVLNTQLDLVVSFSSSSVSFRKSGTVGSQPLLLQQTQLQTRRLHSTATEEVELKVDANGIYDLESKEEHL
jgi:hypothetical protein